MTSGDWSDSDIDSVVEVGGNSYINLSICAPVKDLNQNEFSHGFILHISLYLIFTFVQVISSTCFYFSTYRFYKKLE